MRQNTWRSEIEHHYRRAWGEFAACLFAQGPVAELPSDFSVLCFPRRSGREMWTYAKCGLAQPDDLNPMELHLFSPRQDGGIVELLYAVAHYHRTGVRLGLGDSVNFGRPWLDRSECDRGLISLPYLDGPSLEECSANGKGIRCLWLVPITAAEADYKQRLGLNALEERLEKASFNYLDPQRSSVV